MTREAFVVGVPRDAALRALNYARELDAFANPHPGSFRPRTLRSLLRTYGDSYWSVFTRLDCDRAHGVELISQTDMFAAEPEGRVIRRDSMPRSEDHEVNLWQVLIAGAGQMSEGNLFGRSIIADDRLVGKFLGPHAVGLTFAEPGSDVNLWTYAFLNTAIGLKIVKSCAFGTSVPGLRLDLLGDLPIPVPEDRRLLSKVAGLIRICVEQRRDYLIELRSARRALEDLPEMREAHMMCASRAARVATWEGPLATICAWNFASTGEALSYLRRRWPGRLADVLEPDGVFNGPRFARTECTPPHGIDFYSQRDVFLMRPNPRRIARPAISDRMLFVPREAVIAGSHGQLTDGGIFGKVELASFGAYVGGLTQDLLRLLFKPSERASAFAFLSTLVGQRLLKSTAVGTSIPSMRLDLLRELPYPELSPGQRAVIATHVEAAERARIAASEAEFESIRIIEEVLPSWLA